MTREALSDAVVSQLRALHERIAASGVPFANRLEVSYFPREALRRHDPAAAIHPRVGVDSPLERRPHGSDWVLERSLLRERGVVLAGPPPRELIDAVSADEQRCAVRDLLRDWWAKQLDDPSFLRPREYQAFGVVSICRALHTLETGTLASKPAAAGWALSRLPARFRGLVQRANAWPHGPQPDELAETLELIRFALDRAGPS